MTSTLRRILIVDDENALIFSLSDYLTFRGCRVDCAEGLVDALALVHHLHYDAIVVGVSAESAVTAQRIASEVRALDPTIRTVALAPDDRPLSDENGHPLDVDYVLGRYLPMAQLARVLCNALAA